MVHPAPISGACREMCMVRKGKCTEPEPYPLFDRAEIWGNIGRGNSWPFTGMTVIDRAGCGGVKLEPQPASEAFSAQDPGPGNQPAKLSSAQTRRTSGHLHLLQTHWVLLYGDFLGCKLALLCRHIVLQDSVFISIHSWRPAEGECSRFTRNKVKKALEWPLMSTRKDPHMPSRRKWHTIHTPQSRQKVLPGSHYSLLTDTSNRFSIALLKQSFTW